MTHEQKTPKNVSVKRSDRVIERGPGESQRENMAQTNMARQPRKTVVDLSPEAVRQRIADVLAQVERPGMDRVLEWLENSDFFTAPASTQYHSACPGGLALHSYIVCRLLRVKNKKLGLGLSQDSVAVTGLLHDLAKCNTYVVQTKNVKDGKKQNWKGEIVDNWTEKQVWAVEDKIPLGHGEKSAFSLLKLIELSDQEIAMVRWHMGPYDNEKGFTRAAAVWPSVVALYTCDMEAAYIIEARKTAQSKEA